MKKVRQVLFTASAIVALAIVSLGQASKLNDLVGARAGQAEGDLERRGYVFTHREDGGDSIYSYWWNQKDRKCVCIRTEDGRYASITDSEPFDCNQKDGDNLSTGAKVGIAAGAAAIIGAIALAHRSHHHDDGKHYDDANKEAEYERGYRDGLYNSTYHNYSNTREYSTGYSAGVEQRKNNTRHSTGRGGYRPHVNVSDLVGARGSSGESELESRGFRNVDGFKSGTTSYTIWWNGRTSQCLQVATADGRYDSIVEIQHPKCR